jgi:hypothetical protein
MWPANMTLRRLCRDKAGEPVVRIVLYKMSGDVLRVLTAADRNVGISARILPPLMQPATSSGQRWVMAGKAADQSLPVQVTPSALELWNMRASSPTPFQPDATRSFILPERDINPI